MDNAKIVLDNGIEKEVPGIIYIYNSKYYLIYTEKKLDESGYVLLNLVQVGKEIKNTEVGPVETGYMIGLEVSNEEYSEVQRSITKIVEDKKNGTQSPEIQYLPMTILNPLKILSKKTFKLLRPIVEQYFNIAIEDQSVMNTLTPSLLENDSRNIFTKEKINIDEYEEKLMDKGTQIYDESSNNKQESYLQTRENINFAQTESNEAQSSVEQNADVIIDYRSSFFEEKQKNAQLEEIIKDLTEKLQNIKKIIE